MIHPSQLTVGLFVDINLPWNEHPFLYSKFRITSTAQIADIQALGLAQVKYFPEKSTSAPSPAPSVAVPPPSADAAPKAATPTDFELEKRAKLQAQKDTARRAERGWENAAKQTREALIGLGRSPKQAGQLLSKLSLETAEKVSAGGEIL